jgi:hypothetical protein
MKSLFLKSAIILVIAFSTAALARAEGTQSKKQTKHAHVKKQNVKKKSSPKEASSHNSSAAGISEHAAKAKKPKKGTRTIASEKPHAKKSKKTSKKTKPSA